MSAMQREPTNEQLWSQPEQPSTPPLPAPAQLAPLSQPTVGRRPSNKQFVLAVISLVFAIPLTAIASERSLFALLLTWGGIVAVNAILWMSTSHNSSNN
jgi:hypothetical protein